MGTYYLQLIAGLYIKWIHSGVVANLVILADDMYCYTTKLVEHLPSVHLKNTIKSNK